MQSAACPRCAEPVRIPDSDASVTVRCPWCRETFQLSDAIAKLPPVLEIVALDDAEPNDSGGADFSAIAASLGTADSLSSDSLSGEDFASADGSELATHGSFTPDAFGESGVRRGPPRRSQAGSPFKSFLKMAAGGIAGIAIALLILQYMGRLPDLGFWPFQGPNRGAFADSRDSLAAREEQGTHSWRSDEPPAGWQPTDPAPAPDGAAAPESPLALPLPDFENAPDPASEPNPAGEPNPADEAEMETGPAASDPTSNPEPAPEIQPAAESPAEPEDPSTPESPAESGSPSLRQAIARATGSLEQYNQLESDEAVSAEARLQPLVDSLAALGGELLDADGEAHELGEQRAEIDSLVDAMAADRPLLKQLLAATGERIEGAEEERQEGAFAIGQLSAEGDEYLLKKSTSDPNPLKMRVDDPKKLELPPEGAIVLVLGRLDSDSPGTLLAGYLRSLTPRK